MNVAIITLDSLRFDATQIANTPNIKNYFDRYSNEKNWVKVNSHGTYTLPAHMSILHNGRLPGDPELNFPYDAGHGSMSVFRNSLPWIRNKPAVFTLPDSQNIVKGFSKVGYRTVGIGGVGWFNTEVPTSAFWKDFYFDEFYWNSSFHEEDINSFENQLNLTDQILNNHPADQKLFMFLNISSTHAPYRHNGNSVEGQARCLEYVDQHIPRLLEKLPKPCYVVMCADHGECFGEDGYHGHAFYHPKVMEIPMNIFVME